MKYYAIALAISLMPLDAIQAQDTASEEPQETAAEPIDWSMSRSFHYYADGAELYNAETQEMYGAINASVLEGIIRDPSELDAPMRQALSRFRAYALNGPEGPTFRLAAETDCVTISLPAIAWPMCDFDDDEEAEPVPLLDPNSAGDTFAMYDRFRGSVFIVAATDSEPSYLASLASFDEEQFLAAWAEESQNLGSMLRLEAGGEGFYVPTDSADICSVHLDFPYFRGCTSAERVEIGLEEAPFSPTAP